MKLNHSTVFHGYHNHRPPRDPLTEISVHQPIDILMRNLSEGEEEEKLAGCDDGTFIILKNHSTDNIKFIISLRYSKQTRHVVIQDHFKGFYSAMKLTGSYSHPYGS